MTHAPTQHSKLPVFLALTAMLVWLYGGALLTGQFGQIGPDPDDAMRYVQIRDWLNGQSWFDTNQYRLGLASGTDMHWSRLPDVPIAILAWIFDLFTTEERALHLAAAVWPPLLGAVLLLVFVRAAEKLSGDKTRRVARLAALGLGLVFICLGIRFKPGAIDHHNIQMVLLLGGVVGLLSVSRFKSGLIAGAALAAAIAIGPEVYPFVALIGAFVALDWAWLGEERRGRTVGFGLGFAMGLLGLFLPTIAPSEYARVYCDQLSLPIILAGLTGGLGLALIAQFGSQRSLIMRLLALSGIGLIVLMQIASVAPQCFGNPLNDLPETLHLFWLDHVTEAKPLGRGEVNPLYAIPYFIGTAVVALAVLMWRLSKRGPSSNGVLLIICLLCAIGLTIYQVRFYMFAQLFAVLPLSVWIAACFVAGRERETNIAYMGAIVLSLPFMLGVPGLLFEPEKEIVEDKASCVSEDILAALKALPESVILAPTSEGSVYLKETPHRVLGGNYHRNVAGLQAAIRLNMESDLQEAFETVQAYGLDYILSCPSDNQAALTINEHPDGFAARLSKGSPPTWLDAVSGPQALDGSTLYRVKN